jgi:hypothetical protein
MSDENSVEDKPLIIFIHIRARGKGDKKSYDQTQQFHFHFCKILLDVYHTATLV